MRLNKKSVFTLLVSSLLITSCKVSNTEGSAPASGGSSGGGGGGHGGGTYNPDWQPRTSVRMFGSGHSLMDNPLVDYIADIANKKGDSYNYNQQIGLGSPIRMRTFGSTWNNPSWPGYSTGKSKNGVNNLNVINEFLNPQTLGAGERYDTLVITERHDSLLSIQWEDTVGLLRHYHDRFIAGNSAGQTYFYHSWLSLNKADPTLWIDHEKKALVAWECVASKVNLTLQADNRQDRIRMLPAGGALVDLVEKAIAGQVPGMTGSTADKMNMIFSDNVHTTSLGMYYMSLVTYSAIYAKSPVGAAVPSGIDSTVATAMQQIAWNYVNSYLSNPNAGVRTMDECSNYITQSVCSSYWTLQNDLTQIPICQNQFNINNANRKFRWPDPNYVAYPAP